MSEETRELILTGSLSELELFMFDLRDYVNMRNDSEEVIEMIVENTQVVNSQMKICGKKRPDEAPHE